MVWSIESNIKGYWIRLFLLPFQSKILKFDWREEKIKNHTLTYTHSQTLLENTSFLVSSSTDAMQNHSIYQAVRTNCKILNSLSHKMSTESNASGGSGPHFLNAGTFRMAFRCPHNSPAVHKRNQYKVQAQSLRVLEKEGTTRIVQPKPLTLPMRMLRPQRWRDMSKVKWLSMSSQHQYQRLQLPLHPNSLQLHQTWMTGLAIAFYYVRTVISQAVGKQIVNGERRATKVKAGRV